MDTPSRHGEDENDSDFLHHQRYKDRDSASINTDTSALSGASLEGVSTKESILSRFSLSRKGSTGKFISWSRGNKKAAKAEGEELEEEVADDNDVTPQMQHHHNNKGGLWSGWKKEEHESAGEEEDAGGRGRLTPLAKESSPWMKGNHQSGFFGAIGRAKKEVGGGEEEVIREETGEKKGLGIFTRRKEERE